MKIQKSNNNKGHGYGIVFPDWLAYLIFIGLITLLSGFSFAVIVAIRLIWIPGLSPVNVPAIIPRITANTR